MNGSGSRPITMDPGWPHVVQQTVLPLFRRRPRIPGPAAGCARYARCCLVGLRASAGAAKSMPRPKTQAANPIERDVIVIPAKGIKKSSLDCAQSQTRPLGADAAAPQTRPRPGVALNKGRSPSGASGILIGGLGYARTPEVKNTLRAANIPHAPKTPQTQSDEKVSECAGRRTDHRQKRS